MASVLAMAWVGGNGQACLRFSHGEKFSRWSKKGGRLQKKMSDQDTRNTGCDNFFNSKELKRSIELFAVLHNRSVLKPEKLSADVGLVRQKLA